MLDDLQNIQRIEDVEKQVELEIVNDLSEALNERHEFLTPQLAIG